jgi:predicted RND superfamily exporter protein
MSWLQAIHSGELRERLEDQFGAWGYVVCRHRWLVIMLVALVCAGLFSQLKNIRFDGTFTGFFYKEDPALKLYNEFRDQYGRDNNIVVLLKTNRVFDFEFLDYLKAFHEQLEQEIPYLVEVDSLINARQTRGVDDTLVVRDFLEQWPKNGKELHRLQQQALRNPNYIGTFLSADAHYTAIHIKNQAYSGSPSGDQSISDDLMAGFDEVPKAAPVEKHVLNHIEEAEIRDALDRVIDQFKRPGVEIYVAGGAYTTSAMVDIYAQGMTKYTGFAVLVIGFLLLVIFRRLSMVFLPLTVAVLAMLSSLAPMAILKIPVSFSMQIVPPFLIAVGVGNSVHICTIFYQAINRGDSKTDAIAYSLQHCGLAVVMTSLTTAGGLLSFLSSHMKPIAEFGTITPLGVVFTLLFSLIFLPALLAVIPVKPHARRSDSQNKKIGLVEKTVAAVGDYSVTHANQIIAIWFISIAIALFAASKINFSFWTLKQLPPDHPIATAIKAVDKNLSGIVPLEIIVDSGRENGVKDPAFLKKLDAVNDLVADFNQQGKRLIRAISIVNINKELHQALNRNNKRFYTIPNDPALVAQELLLFENSGSDDLEKVVDSQFRYARVTISIKNSDAVVFKPILDEFFTEFDKIFAGYSYKKTGVTILTVSIFNELYLSMAKSYVIAFLIITPLMVLLIGSVRIGLLCMIPNLAPIVLTLGMMGAAGIDLTTATLLVGSVAMGLAVDDTIHIMHNFQRYNLRGDDVLTAIRKTFETTGMAITFTTLVLTAGFLIFMFNTLIEWIFFGLVASFSIAVALLADLTLAPALLAKLYKYQPVQE